MCQYVCASALFSPMYVWCQCVCLHVRYTFSKMPTSFCFSSWSETMCGFNQSWCSVSSVRRLMWHTQTHDHTHAHTRSKCCKPFQFVRWTILTLFSWNKPAAMHKPMQSHIHASQCQIKKQFNFLPFFFAYTSKCFSIQIINSFRGFGVIK